MTKSAHATVPYRGMKAPNPICLCVPSATRARGLSADAGPEWRVSVWVPGEGNPSRRALPVADEMSWHGHNLSGKKGAGDSL